MSSKSHWERVYQTKDATRVSWYQVHPTVSLELVEAAGATQETRIIDVGGGASRLVDELLQRGCTRLAVLDVSATALALAKARLGPAAAHVDWYVADVTTFDPPQQWDLWHDRAVFHFLTEADDRAGYRRVLERAVPVGGHVIIGTFSLEGPERCSGLDVVRYSPDSLSAELGPQFEPLVSRSEGHQTPSGIIQAFSYSFFRRCRPDRRAPRS